MAETQRNNAPSIAYGVKWHKIERPRTWKPAEAGSELVGHYLGMSLREGRFGPYSVALFSVPTGEGLSQPYVVSGTSLISRLTGGGVEVGQLVRIVFDGKKDLDGGRQVKLFEVYVGEGRLSDETAALLFSRVEAGESDGEAPEGSRTRRCGVCQEPGHDRRTCRKER